VRISRLRLHDFRRWADLSESGLRPHARCTDVQVASRTATRTLGPSDGEFGLPQECSTADGAVLKDGLLWRRAPQVNPEQDWSVRAQR
jgi:hypothetical protein